MTAITPNYFEIHLPWVIVGKRYINDAGFSYVQDNKVIINHVLVRGIGGTEDDLNTKVQYKKRLNGRRYFFYYPWKRPNIVRFDQKSEGLWLIHLDKVYDIKETAYEYFIPMEFKGVLPVPWLWWNGFKDDIEIKNVDVLPNEWFEI